MELEFAKSHFGNPLNKYLLVLLQLQPFRSLDYLLPFPSFSTIIDPLWTSSAAPSVASNVKVVGEALGATSIRQY